MMVITIDAFWLYLNFLAFFQEHLLIGFPQIYTRKEEQNTT